ncbi:TadG family pilus assembly protein [Collimonas humicola]|uniref:TadG family pilus assembly protein n=1 Tax=Collimonas humicola TaxID=2825886 RepID=UPI0022A71447|nr:pilus assembly protein TadG-related protein [Collimonas humicola]
MSLFLSDAAARVPAPSWLRGGRRRARGSVAVMAAIFLSLVVILLSSIDIGYMFYMKRDLQKAADLAALAGAQQLVSTPLAGNPTTCGATDAPVLAAIGNAQINGFSTTAPNPMANAITVTCGRWDPAANASLAPSFFSAPAAGASLNAVQVALTQNVPAFFGLGSRTLNAQAIASSSDPYAAFSIGSNLLTVNSSGAVPVFLSALGLNLSGTSLVTYNGLANVSITPNGLLQALGFQIPLHASVGTITTLLNANTAGCSNGVCTLQALLGAVSVVGSQQNLISALGLTAGQLSLPVRLLSIPPNSDGTGGQGGLFTMINAADGQSALNLNLSALDIVSTAIAVGNGYHAVSGTVSVPNVLNTQIGIVEPPSIGVGGVGTTAFTSQVRLYTRIQANLQPLLSIDLPLIVDVVNGLGKIERMCNIADRDPSGNDRAVISVNAPILSVCAGQFNGTVDGSTAFSTNGACSKNLTAYPNMVTVLGMHLINTPIAIDGLPNSSPGQPMVKGQTVTYGANNLAIGTTLSNVFNALVGALTSSLLGNQSTGATVNNTNLASNLLSITNQNLAVAQSTVTSGLTALNTLAANPVAGLVNSLGGLVGNVLSSVGQLVSGLLCLGNSQCILSTQLAGSQNSGGASVSNALVSLLGIVVNLLQPILNTLGSALATLLNNVVGVQLGTVDVKLIDLNCGGASVKLVY